MEATSATLLRIFVSDKYIRYILIKSSIIYDLAVEALAVRIKMSFSLFFNVIRVLGSQTLENCLEYDSKLKISGSYGE